MGETLVHVENVSKKFCRDLKTGLWYGVKDLATEFVGGRKGEATLRPKEFWAVDDINFELERGQCLGLIGRNGAGKSTLLKMLNGLIKPDKGKITMCGRVGALIELGSGFNPILTGRENIYNNGAVLGISKKEIDLVIDEIIDFSEIEKFIDTPVQFYSSGMKVRLGFAVAVHMKPDVLILDEVLAVGDSGFKMKSFNKINEMMKDAAVIFVSHSMPNVANICNKILLMEKGQKEYYGEDISEGIDRYFREFAGYNPKVEFDEFCTLNEATIRPSEKYESISTDEMPVIDYGSAIEVSFEVEVPERFEEFHVRLLISDKDLRYVGLYDSFHLEEPLMNESGAVRGRITLPNCQFIDGEYAMTFFFVKRDAVNSNWEMLGIYRYWRKFKVRASRGLGVTPVVVYLPGKLEQNKLELK
jgi:lipopolysaccharide transport system ATP-binding protein